jgi:hypothetical protein
MTRVIVTGIHEKLMLHYILLTRQIAKLSDSLLLLSYFQIIFE